MNSLRSLHGLGRLLASVGWLAPACLLTAGALAQSTERASVDSQGAQADNSSGEPSASDDGRYIAFQSQASNLVTGDTNNLMDIFVRDRQTGVTERVSVDSSGNQASFGSFNPSISADGRYVAFRSVAPLVAGDTNGFSDIFVRDRQAGVTELVSLNSAGAQTNDHSLYASISGDGNRVAFESGATNLSPGDTNGVNDNFVHDRTTGNTVIVSVHSSGAQANGVSYSPDISADGRYVAFESTATNLVTPGTTFTGVFVHDLATSATELAGVDSAGVEANDDTHRPVLSGDGRWLAFDSKATNLVPGDLNGVYDTFVHDRQTGATTLVSVDSFGNQGNGLSGVAAISNNGCMIAYETLATNLVSGDNNGSFDIVLYNRQKRSTIRVSVDTFGVEGNAASRGCVISGDGSYVAFRSDATNLVPGDTNNAADVFVRDLGEISGAVNYCTAGVSTSNCRATLNASGQPSASAASGFVVTANLVEGQKDGLFFYGQNGRQANSWGNGTSFQCVVPPVQRGGLQLGSGTAGACDAVIAQDLNARWCPSCPNPNQAPLPGSELQLQFWYRDPQNTSNQTTGLSDALEVDVCP